MKQEIFDTRQRAIELLNKSISIWRNSDHADKLEGVERDPVFSLLITALAYQANETDSDIERLKQDVLDEYARLLTPYEVGHAIPATAVVEATPQSHVSEIELTEKSTFVLEDVGYQFMPLLQSRVINAMVSSIVRLDGRRWKLTLKFHEPITDLSGLTFAIKNAQFRDLKVSINDQLLPLVKPWQYADMPLQPCFTIDALLYNHAQLYRSSMIGLDLLARQNTAVFYVKKHEPKQFIPVESESIDLIFDFSGISDNFVFDKSHFSLNTVILVNTQLNTCTLTSELPFVRVAGSNDLAQANSKTRQLMHLIPPAEEQLFGKTPVEVRRVAADRFNKGALLKLVNSLINKFNSDYYAFQDLKDTNTQAIINTLQEALTQLSNAAHNDDDHNIEGVYLMLNRQAIQSSPSISLDIDYLTTDGAVVNNHLQADSKFSAPAGLEGTVVKQIAEPGLGYDEVKDAESIQSLVRYYMVTNDRIVTPADMKIFCYKELMSRYSIVPKMVSNISVSYAQQQDRVACGYAFYVNIELEENPFVERSFSNKIPQAEMLLERMMAVRSANIYPIFVTISMKEVKNEH